MFTLVPLCAQVQFNYLRGILMPGLKGAIDRGTRIDTTPEEIPSNKWMPLLSLLSRSSLSTCFCLCLHCWHVCSGLPVGVCLLLLPSLLDVSGTDHQGVVLLPPTLQSRSLGQPAAHVGTSLVHLLALSSHPVSFTWWRNKLQCHGIAGTQPIAAESLNNNRLFTFTMMVTGVERSRKNDQEEMAWDKRRHEYFIIV